MNKARKSIFLVMLSFSILTFQKSPILTDDELGVRDLIFHSKYKDGNVYIGTKEEYEEVKGVLKSEDVFILDERKREDPNMKVYDSYKINDLENQREILKIMRIYEELYPSDWNRSMKSMLIEWEVHNILYHMNYKMVRTKDVDFNNVDEEMYRTLKLKR